MTPISHAGAGHTPHRGPLAATAVGVAIAAVRLYQHLAPPRVRSACRHWPTCSSYAIEALERHGFVAGIALAARRLISCHPFGSSGVDPVPAARSPRADRPGL